MPFSGSGRSGFSRKAKEPSNRSSPCVWLLWTNQVIGVPPLWSEPLHFHDDFVRLASRVVSVEWQNI